MTRQDTPEFVRYLQLLARREAELHALLHTCTAPAAQDAGSREVADFKDMAQEESRATVDEAQALHAIHELQQVQAARRRIADGSYGLCLDCGEPIEPQRLAALPAAAYCPACQAVREKHGKAASQPAVHA